jgi:DNA topoisomerase IA
MVTKVLCVAEKPSIAKAVANHLAGQNVQTVSRALVFILPKQR